MRIAKSIEIKNEIKTDEEGLEYKEVLIKDENGDVLEVFRGSVSLETEEDFFNQTGVKLGVSAWM
jgi:hypothetical protein